MDSHTPVLLQETINSLNIKPNGIYVDLTLGRANHSKEVLTKLEKGLLIGFDKDNQAIKNSKVTLSKISNNFKLFHSDFCKLEEKLKEIKINLVDGIMADLGVSSPQLDDAKRGFSYNKDAKLDMRMDQSQKESAFEIVNNYSFEELALILKKYGQVKNANQIAKAICAKRPVKKTLELVEIIKQSLPSAIVRKKNPAKSVFQAIRIAVNQELDNLEKMLHQVTHFLKPGGVLAIITFHSLEDQIVKHFFKTLLPKSNNKLPIQPQILWDSKQLRPTKKEIETNKRARSAKLRILRRKP